MELAHIEDSPRVWCHLNSSFAFGTMRNWVGRTTYRRKTVSLVTGDTFFFDPGEMFRGTPDRGAPGTFRVFEVAPDMLVELCREEGFRGPVHFADIVRQAPRPLALALDALERALLSDTDALEQQSRLVELAHAASTTVMERSSSRSPRAAPFGPCERLREILHSTEATRVNLSAFAREADVSQYQLLRAFKRRFGSPPHAYGLYVRLDLARRLLRQGHTVASAAAAADFTDQSHLTRHFRRIWGVTPGRYAAAR